jgi:hypothetical protein
MSAPVRRLAAGSSERRIVRVITSDCAVGIGVLGWTTDSKR